jgi:hypothetical protein
MSQPPVKPFGRRGLAPSPGNPARQNPRPAPGSTPELPREIVEAVMGERRADTDGGPKPAEVTRVGWSFRAALLAGLIVGLLSAATRVTGFLGFGARSSLNALPLGNIALGQISLGEAEAPILTAIAIAGLVSGARASALALLIAHKGLARFGYTSLTAYSLGGAAISLAYALVAALVWTPATPVSLGLEALSGLGAGFFYRLFAATERA